jgi:hypothetical protein
VFFVSNRERIDANRLKIERNRIGIDANRTVTGVENGGIPTFVTPP